MEAHKIGILGGTFNPVHFGHLAAAEEVKNRLGLDKVLFIPSFLPPHKQDEELPGAEHRLEMVRLAVRDNPAFEPCDIEIRRGGRSYTIDTIEELQRLHPRAEFYFVTGIDTFLEIQTWQRWAQLLARCRFVVLSRPGYRFSCLANIDFMKGAGSDLADLDSGARTRAVVRSGAYTVYLEMIPLYDISSTDIRARVRNGTGVKYLLPDAVETYIIKNKFYA
ncbi:MAG TPA: nicotinate-nucleotide adenylyltransferase [Nitrospirota bacterium]|nr:nicotinate-nucleotide adenylyltransferase [Nitrospirota bacterium]